MAKESKNTVKVPNLRFPGFTEEWEIKKLQDVVKINQGLQIMISERLIEAEDGAHFYITNEFLKKSSEKKYFIKNPPSSVLCTEEDILMTRTGNTGMVVTNVSGAFHNNFFKVAYPETIVKGFLYNFLKLPDTQKQIIRLAGTSTIPDLNHSDFYNIKFTFPKKTEQSKIASFVAVIDERIQTQNKIIRELNVLKSVLSRRIFSQEIRFKDNSGSDFPTWETKKLREVCDINPKIKSIPISFYYIDLESVVNGRLLKEDRILKDDAPSRAQRVLAKNDVLFQMVRPYQKNNLFFNKEGEYVASTGYAQIRTKQNSQFLFQYLHNQRFVDKVIERCTGTSYPAISSTDLGNIEIDYPSLAEQIKIACFFSAVDKKNDIEANLLQKLNEQKKFLLQQMFI